MSWQHMKARCLNPDHKDFKFYGGRGISVCERWLVFENFLEDMGQRPRGLTIERIHNDGNYEKKNCKWATRKEQVMNKRGNFQKGMRGRRGAEAPWAKLTPEQVAEIRALRGKKSQREIGLMFGIVQGTVCMIQTGKTWTDGQAQ